MAKIIQIIILLFISLIMMSSSCDKGIEGCTESNACNYDEAAAIDDNSCWFANDGCNCTHPQGSTVDCLRVCDTNMENDPPDDAEGNCDDGVIGGCIDTLMCNYNISATHNDGSCAIDLSEFGGLPDGTDCSGECEGIAVMDGCDNQGCIGGINDYLEPWKIIIYASATIKSTLSDTIIAIDSSKVTIGVSLYALDGYNKVEQGGGNSNCSDSCYVDIIENPPGLNKLIRFYFPHEEWVDDLENFEEPSFIQDMRYYDLQALFSSGIQWEAIISPFNLSYGSIIEEISISYKYEGAIEKSEFIISVEGNQFELTEDEFLQYSVNSDDDIQLIFNISNICIE